jgi:hypothetical protein
MIITEKVLSLLSIYIEILFSGFTLEHMTEVPYFLIPKGLSPFIQIPLQLGKVS